MTVTRAGIVTFVGAVVALLLQIIVAPNIALFSSMPNFIVAYVLIAAILRPQNASPVLPFVLGLSFDLLAGGPLGAMSFLLVLASFCASRTFAALDNDTAFIPLAIFAVGALAVETLYAVLIVATGTDVSMLDALVHRALPCTLFDCVIGFIMYPFLVRAFASASQQQQPGTTRLR